jgi:hypothetical protein
MNRFINDDEEENKGSQTDVADIFSGFLTRVTYNPNK